jgi:GT2 family glycosyltransferase
MNPAAMPMTSRDVEDCYALWLGRVPDADVLARCVNTPLGETLIEIFKSPEFQAQVLTPLLLREPLPQAKRAAAPALRLLDWAQKRLPLGPTARAAAGAAGSWTLLLEGLLADPTLIALAPHLVTAGIDRLCRERLEQSPQGPVTRAVIGAIDSASALEIHGWAVDLCDKSAPVTLEFYADNRFIGATECRDPRADVAESVGGNGRCGFTFRIPTARRSSFDGGRVLVAVDAVSRKRVGVSTPVHADPTAGADLLGATRRELRDVRTLLERLEARLPDLTRLASVPLESYPEYWERFYRLAPDVLAEQRAACRGWADHPLISVVIPTWNPNTLFLDQAIESVRAQTYPIWELILADDASEPSDAVQRLIARHADPRIRPVSSTERAGIAGNTNRGIAAATGDYVAFLDHDDELAPDALYHVAQCLKERRYALVYSDEDRLQRDALGRWTHVDAFFKPGFDPDLLRSLNYICHLVVIRRDLLTAVGGLTAGLEGAQDHDLLLRLSERVHVHDVRHLARILYHWRITPGSVSQSPEKALTLQATIVATVQAHLDRGRHAALAEAHADAQGAARAFATRVRWALPTPAPRVSVIIPTRDRLDLLKPCLDSILRTVPAYAGEVEILVMDNDSVEPATHAYLARLEHASPAPDVAATVRTRVMPFRGEFNWSAINNAGAGAATGEVLIFLNNDTVVLSEDWLETLVAQALRPVVGAVGARLLYDDGTLQHAGVVLGVGGVAGHDSVGEPPEQGGYYGRSHLQRRSAAVTGACLATRREVFLEVGGFDEIHLKVAFNDVDFCLKLREAGYAVIYEPFAVLYHYESKSRGYDLSEAKRDRIALESAVFRERWRTLVDADPYYNPHFERQARPFQRLRPPAS